MTPLPFSSGDHGYRVTALALPHVEPLPRVDIISGSFGAGHDASAFAIGEQLIAQYDIHHWDVVDLMTARTGPLLRAAYLKQVQLVPDSWRWLLGRLDRPSRLLPKLLAKATPGIADIVAAKPAMIISTHPFASQALGELGLSIPTVTYLTDMSVHPLWVHQNIDVHLAIHQTPADQALARGARKVHTIAPAVASRFSIARIKQRDPQLPSGPLALVTGGSHGIGELAATAYDVLHTGLATPVVLCGHNTSLLRSLQSQGIASLGWINDMPRLLASVDVVVQNAGGMTTLETRAAGLRTLTHRCLPGHGETNAAALDAAGLAPWSHSVAELAVNLEAALERSSIPSRSTSPSVAEVLGNLSAREHLELLAN